MKSLSLVIITLNEETNIERCIRSVPFASEVIVLDSGSSDRTVECAKKLGAKVFVESFRGFRAQKARAVELASHDWILSLDADEALSAGLREEIERVLSESEEESQSLGAYAMPRMSFYLGRWILHGGWYPDMQTRVFHRKRAVWGGGHVHERIELVNGAEMKTLRSPIEHYVFQNIAHQVGTNNLYSTKGALDLHDKKVLFNLDRLIVKPVSKFLETYILKFGFLDGLPGFLISISAAYSIFLKYAKLWEIEKFGRAQVERRVQK